MAQEPMLTIEIDYAHEMCLITMLFGRAHSLPTDKFKWSALNTIAKISNEVTKQIRVTEWSKTETENQRITI